MGGFCDGWAGDGGRVRGHERCSQGKFEYPIKEYVLVRIREQKLTIDER